MALPDNKLAVIEGLEGYLIAESDNVLLICKKDEEHAIRKYVNDAQIKMEKNIFRPIKKHLSGERKCGSRTMMQSGSRCFIQKRRK